MVPCHRFLLCSPQPYSWTVSYVARMLCRRGGKHQIRPPMKDSPGGGGTLRTRTLCRYSGSCKVSRSLTIDGPGENPDKHTATPSHRTNHILVPAAQPLRHRLRGRAHRPWPVRSQYNRYFTQPRDINTEIATLSAFFNSGSCLVLPPPWLGVWFPSE